MLIAQSGGPSSAINSSVAGAISKAMESDKIDQIYGAVNGSEGVLNRKIINITDQLKSQEDIDLLIGTPAQALGTSRYKIPKGDDGDKVFAQILEILHDYDIGYFFFNGGNDSMDTVSRLAQYLDERDEDIIAVGIPKTIDNDLVGTDHTPGFGCAARYVATSISELYMDTIVYDRPYVVICEIMGRNAGWLTAASALARNVGLPAPHLIYLPEVPFDKDAFITNVKDKISSGGDPQVIVAVSEGLKLEDGSYIADTGGALDSFGHPTLSGVAQVLESLVTDKLGSDIKTRAIQFSTLQRSAAHIASGTDLEEAFQCGFRAVEAALEGTTSIMVTMERTSNSPYAIKYDVTPLSEVANKEKKVPLEWITKDGTDVSNEMIEYLKPLITGEVSPCTEQGLPVYFRFDRNLIVSP